MPTMSYSAVAALLGAALEHDRNDVRAQGVSQRVHLDAEAPGAVPKSGGPRGPLARVPDAPAPLVHQHAAQGQLPAKEGGAVRRPEAKAIPGPSARKSAPPQPPALGATPKGKAAPPGSGRAQGPKDAAPARAVHPPSQEDSTSTSEYYSSYSESQSSEPPAQEERKTTRTPGPRAPQEARPGEASGKQGPRAPSECQESPRRRSAPAAAKAGDLTPTGRERGNGKVKFVQMVHDALPTHQPDYAAGGDEAVPRHRSPSARRGDRPWDRPRSEDYVQSGRRDRSPPHRQRRGDPSPSQPPRRGSRRSNSRNRNRRRGSDSRSRSRRVEHRGRGRSEDRPRDRREGKGRQEGRRWPGGGHPQEEVRQGQGRLQDRGAPQAHGRHRHDRLDPTAAGRRQPHYGQPRRRDHSPHHQQGRGKGKKGKGAKGKNRKGGQQEQPRAEPRAPRSNHRLARAAQRYKTAADALQSRAEEGAQGNHPRGADGQPGGAGLPEEPRPASSWFDKGE